MDFSRMKNTHYLPKDGYDQSFHISARRMRVISSMLTRWYLLSEMECFEPDGNSLSSSYGSRIVRLSDGSIIFLSMNSLPMAGMENMHSTEENRRVFLHSQKFARIQFILRWSLFLSFVSSYWTRVEYEIRSMIHSVVHEVLLLPQSKPDESVWW